MRGPPSMRSPQSLFPEASVDRLEQARIDNGGLKDNISNDEH